MGTPIAFERSGVGLAGVDFGGSGPGALLLHGLAGHAREWADTAAWLTGRCRVVALDARGHGHSEWLPADVSQAAHAADAAMAIELLELAPAVVVGQSLGSLTALLLAAGRPELVGGLVIAEGSPDAGGGGAAIEVERSLKRWPVPFRSRADALEHLKAQAWVDGLEQREDGLWPRFDVDVMVRTLREADSRTYWDEWEAISCPTLVVRGERGTLPADHARTMVARAQNARLAEIPHAGHDLHLEQPERWRRVLEAFLDSLAAAG